MKKLVIFALLLSVSTAAIAGVYGDKVKKIKSPKGTTLTGVVYCGDEPLAGVSVTDGREIVKTDNNGIYRIDQALRACLHLRAVGIRSDMRGRHHAAVLGFDRRTCQKVRTARF